MATLTFVLSGLQHTELKQLPSLSMLLKRAHKTAAPLAANFDTLAFDLFNLAPAETLPVAAVSGLAHGLATNAGWWLRADPMAFLTDWTGIYAVGCENLQLTPEEVAQATALINDFLILENMVLYSPAPNEWYLQTETCPEMYADSSEAVIGKEISQYLPQGKRKQFWCTLFTEIQMLLHSAPFNQQRQLEGRALLEAVWLWGSGRLPSPPAQVWQKVWGNASLIQGLAHLTGTDIEKATCLNSINWDKQNLTGDYLITVNAQSETDAQASMLTLEQNWFAPLLDALKAQRFTTLRFYIGEAFFYDVSAAAFRSWWRRLF